MAANGTANASLNDLLRAEAGRIKTRRQRFSSDVEEAVEFENTVGLALSGGGIRSATFCLGFLQALSAGNLTKRIDYISSVSGGSYVSGFFGALFVPSEKRGYLANADDLNFNSERPLQSERGEEAVRRLRDAGRYLTPAGTSDAFFAAAVVSRNWAAVHAVIGLTALLAFWVIRFIDSLIAAGGPAGFSPTLEIASLIFLVLVFAFGSAYWLTRREWIPKSRLRRVYTNTFAIIFAFGFVFAAWSAGAGVSAGDLSVFTLIWLFLASFMGVAIIGYIIAEALYGAYVSTKETVIAAKVAKERESGTVEGIEKSAPGEERNSAVRPGGGTVIESDRATGKTDRSNDEHIQFRIAAEDKVRTALSDWMSKCMAVLLLFVGTTILDYFGYLLLGGFEQLVQNGFSGGDSIVATLKLWSPIAVALAPPILSYVARTQLKKKNAEVAANSKGQKGPDRFPIVLVVAGASLVALWLVIWSAASRYGYETFVGYKFAVGIALLVITIVQSLCFSFINLSSLSTFYATRLRRAYIGASSSGSNYPNVRQDNPQDTILVQDYYDAGIGNGAPLHLINVTIAETISGTSNLVSRDRKGKPMHLSPSGIVFEADRPGVFKTQANDAGEQLPLANWIAISGAAISAAIGSGTTLGTSILATMANLRLGYWWKSVRAEKLSSNLWRGWKDTVQNYLFLELLGAFDGTRRNRWYLTDGGHFENTGIYSLLMRKVGFIIACDNGADPSYDMVDVLRLVQRARVDLGAKITFLTEEQIAAKLGSGSPLIGRIGTLQELRRIADSSNPGGPIATIATISYPNTTVDKDGTLLLVKPRLTFSEPPELLAYHAKPGAGTFPQQSTSDQFFDEEQWEAYRRLGELCGEILFAPTTGQPGTWSPCEMQR